MGGFNISVHVLMYTQLHNQKFETFFLLLK